MLNKEERKAMNNIDQGVDGRNCKIFSFKLGLY